MTEVYVEDRNGSPFFLTQRQRLLLDDKGNSGLWLDTFESCCVSVNLQRERMQWDRSYVHDPLMEWWVWDLREHGWPLLGHGDDFKPYGPTRGCIRYVGNDVQTPDVVFFIVQCLLAAGCTLIPAEFAQQMDKPFDYRRGY